MNILVIGGSKFIGWALVQQLDKLSHDITVINRGNIERRYGKHIRHVAADRNNYDHMQDALGENTYDVVFDMCGFTAPDMQHTLKLLAGRTKRYVFISTAAIYLEPSTLPLTEHSPQGSHGVWGAYGSGKLDCEKLLFSAFKDTGFPVTIIRPSYVYGIGNVIDRETFLFDRISKGRTILMPGDGQAVIQLGDVADLCDALVKVADSKAGIGEAYNVSGDEYVTLNSLVRLSSQIVGKPVKITHVAPSKYRMADRDIFPFDNVTYFTSTQKFRQAFDWNPKTSLQEGLTNAYAAWANSDSKLPTSYRNEDAVLSAIG